MTNKEAEMPLRLARRVGVEGSCAFCGNASAAGALAALGGVEDLPAGVALPWEAPQSGHEDFLKEAFALGSGGAFGTALGAMGRDHR